ncbi:MAG: helix-turn-helix transcriptional regulator [Lachnospiraceae bacterium]|nr:helix-turn-helix transcriptional regulator [Lachnospiraceae bacterium]
MISVKGADGVRATEKITVYELLRKARNYSVKELAEKMGVAQSCVSEIESGKRKPTVAVLEKYSKALCVKQSTIKYFEEERDGKNYGFERSLLMILQKICENCTE